MSSSQDYQEHVRGEWVDEVREREGTLVVLGNASDLDVVFVVAVITILYRPASAPSTYN